MRLTDNTPASWQELQTNVGDILKDCGYCVIVEKEIETLRGKVTVDVFATKSTGYINVVICECKYWGNNVPQNVVHAFRTVVSDYGASYGFIVSKTGFQKGAYDATKNSNISILTWEDFTDRFSDDWLKYIIERNAKMGKILQNFGLYLISHGKQVMPGLYEKQEGLFLAFRNHYSDVVFLTFIELYQNVNSGEISKDEINKRIVSFRNDIPFVVTSYKQYFDYIYGVCKEAITEVEIIFENKISWESICLINPNS